MSLVLVTLSLLEPAGQADGGLITSAWLHKMVINIKLEIFFIEILLDFWFVKLSSSVEVNTDKQVYL